MYSSAIHLLLFPVRKILRSENLPTHDDLSSNYLEILRQDEGLRTNATVCFAAENQTLRLLSVFAQLVEFGTSRDS
jgi:hypothetical protein